MRIVQITAIVHSFTYPAQIQFMMNLQGHLPPESISFRGGSVYVRLSMRACLYVCVCVCVCVCTRADICM